MSYEKSIILGDLHIPWQDPAALKLTLKVADKLKPDIIFLNGDVMDCWEISSFDKNPAHLEEGKLCKEIEQGKNFLRDLRARFPKAKIKYIFGNHEYRWIKFIAKRARELHGLKGMTLEEQLELRELDIDLIYTGNKENSYKYGKLLIGHFDKVNVHSGYTAKNLLDSKGISLIQGHTHRGGSSYRRLWDRMVVAHEGFCLCDINPFYTDRPNWQQGFIICYKDRKSDHFHLDAHPIAQGNKLQTFFRGECIW